MTPDRPKAPITLAEAKDLIKAMAARQSILLLSQPGLGKSDIVYQAAAEAGLEVRSLLGTQIAPEDVSGIPRIVGERSVFCPPRILLPEDPKPFCLFLDELPATSPDVQKAFYSLLLERRLGEHQLPEGTWVVAAGNRVEDRAMVRAMSSALVNRVFMIEVKGSVMDWLKWAKEHHVRADVRAFIAFQKHALMRDVPPAPVPFSTPRAWASLSEALDITEKAGLLTPSMARSLAFARVSAEDAALFAACFKNDLGDIKAPAEYVKNPGLLPKDNNSLMWIILNAIRSEVADGALKGCSPEQVEEFLGTIGREYRFTVLIDLVEKWQALGAGASLVEVLQETMGV